MGLLLPAALFLLPVLAVIAALYLLRLRRPEAAVSSLFLWETLLRDREANAPWQRLRVGLLLLLQLLIAAALIVALARPWAATGVGQGRNLVMVLDTSASMAASDAPGGGTRLAQAQAAAQARAAQLPDNGQATIIAAGQGAEVVLAGSRDPDAVRRAIAGLSVRPGSTDLRPALALAGALVGGQPDAEVAIYSDGRFTDPRSSTPIISATVRFTLAGTRGANQGIVSLALRRNVGTLTLFAEVINGADAPATRRLEIDLDGQAWAGRTLTLGTGETQGVVLDDVPVGVQVVHARLAGSDDLALDDEAWTINRTADPAPVLMVTEANRFLQNALVLLPNITLEKSLPREYAPSPTATLTVFDGWLPATLPPGNLLLLAPPQSSALVDVTGVLTTPQPLVPAVGGGDAVDPLLRNVDLSSLHLARAKQIGRPGWGRVVLDSPDGPLIIAGETDGRRVVVVAFDLHDSDLPVQMAFPLLIRNLTGYLLPEPAGGLPASVPVGSGVLLQPDPGVGVTRLTVDPPGGGRRTSYPVDAQHGRVTYADTNALGVYVVTQWAGDQVVRREGFAANLENADESRTKPRRTPDLPASNILANSANSEPARAEWWPLLAALALLILAIEWLVANQLTLRRLLAEWRARRSRSQAEVL